jgi:hypothetical protein
MFVRACVRVARILQAFARSLCRAIDWSENRKVSRFPGRIKAHVVPIQRDIRTWFLKNVRVVNSVPLRKEAR